MTVQEDIQGHQQQQTKAERGSFGSTMTNDSAGGFWIRIGSYVQTYPPSFIGREFIVLNLTILGSCTWYYYIRVLYLPTY